MEKLSDRLKLISDNIKQGESMADIGTDHGSLPLFLYESGISEKVVMADISDQSLSKAIFAAGPLLNEEGLDARVGDGIAPLKMGEVDDVVMAGMGGVLMTEILEADLEKAHSFKKFILQPRRAPEELRRYLLSHGFKIVDEQLVRESKFIWEIIVAATEEGLSTGNIDVMVDDSCLRDVPKGDIRWELPPYYKDLDDPLRVDYLKLKLSRKELILENRKKSSLEGEAFEASLKEIEDIVSYIEGLIG